MGGRGRGAGGSLSQRGMELSGCGASTTRNGWGTCICVDRLCGVESETSSLVFAAAAAATSYFVQMSNFCISKTQNIFFFFLLSRSVVVYIHLVLKAIDRHPQSSCFSSFPPAHPSRRRRMFFFMWNMRREKNTRRRERRNTSRKKEGDLFKIKELPAINK